MQVYALGLGIGTRNAGGDWLEVYYPQPLLAPGAALLAPLAGTAGVRQLDAAGLTQLANEWRSAGAADAAALAARLAVAQRPCVLTVLADDSAPDSVPAAYLKLQLISHRQVKPHETDLGGIFGILPNVAWTNTAPSTSTSCPGASSTRACAVKSCHRRCVDKFPKMTDYVVPAGVRIADTARVRLGAYVGEGTTVMHEGFINFNAGTIGPGMIEGRISAGVMVGADSDLGGGCSTMGTLSGGGNIVISDRQAMPDRCQRRLGIPSATAAPSSPGSTHCRHQGHDSRRRGHVP
jgi:2,3,4,5-tetrahydropyridine-2-carboxylate N-succinyltransferase